MMGYYIAFQSKKKKKFTKINRLQKMLSEKRHTAKQHMLTTYSK